MYFIIKVSWLAKTTVINISSFLTLVFGFMLHLFEKWNYRSKHVRLKKTT